MGALLKIGAKKKKTIEIQKSQRKGQQSQIKDERTFKKCGYWI